MFANQAGKDFTDQIRYMHDQGFRGIEDNGMLKRSKEEQDKIGNLLAKLGMTMGVFVAHGNFGKHSFADRNDKDGRAEAVQNIKNSVDVAKRCGAKWMTVVPDSYLPNLEWGYQTAACIDLLRQCAEVFEPHNLVMVLEPLNWWMYSNWPRAPSTSRFACRQ